MDNQFDDTLIRTRANSVPNVFSVDDELVVLNRPKQKLNNLWRLGLLMPKGTPRMLRYGARDGVPRRKSLHASNSRWPDIAKITITGETLNARKN